MMHSRHISRASKTSKTPIQYHPTIPSRSFTQSFNIQKDLPQPPKPNPSFSNVSLKETLKDLKGPTRWIVIGSFAVLATAETTFWLKVIHAKFFAKEDDVAAEQFMERFKEALRGYRMVWLLNYQRYYGEMVWGL